MTPVIPVVGNHDAGGFARKTYGAEALYFYYFPYLEEGEREADRDGAFVPISGEGVVVIEEGWKLREESYRVHDLESCSMSMVILDSNHVFSPGLCFFFFSSFFSISFLIPTPNSLSLFRGPKRMARK